MRWLDSIIDLMDVSFSKLGEMVNDWETWCAAVHGITKSGTGLNNDKEWDHKELDMAEQLNNESIILVTHQFYQ